MNFPFKKIVGSILVAAAAFVVGMIAYDAWKSWRARVAARKIAANSTSLPA